MTTVYSQIRIQELTHTIIRVIVKQNNFVAGEVDLRERIFYSIPRSTKNLFHLFHGDKGGLGLNEELLMLDSFDIIKIKFNDSILITSKRKWLTLGIVSPYCNSTVDKQIIMKLSEININDVEKYEQAKIQQQELFSEVTA